MTCIMLAGGLGTRLETTVPGLPKCLAPVAGRPFLDILLASLQERGVTKFIFALGFRHQAILAHLQYQHTHLSFTYSVEQEPMGTAGALRLALQETKESHVLATNADTYFDVDLRAMMQFHLEQEADVTIALKPLKDIDRYGSVDITDGRITAFHEKKPCSDGLVNAGVYVLRSDLPLPATGSFEKDCLSVGSHDIFGFVHDGQFIDIGTPEDYAKANLLWEDGGLSLGK